MVFWICFVSWGSRVFTRGNGNRMTTNDDVTGMINAFARGDESVRDELFARIYDELKVVAKRAARGNEDLLYLETGVLVSELYIKLVDQKKADWSCRGQFLGFAASAMRRIRVDIARHETAIKRAPPPASPDDLAPSKDPKPDAKLLSAERDVRMEEALLKLEQMDARQAKIVELRYFGGMTVADAGLVVGLKPRQVKGDTAMAFAWLHVELGPLAKDLDI